MAEISKVEIEASTAHATKRGHITSDVADIQSQLTSLLFFAFTTKESHIHDLLSMGLDLIILDVPQ